MQSSFRAALGVIPALLLASSDAQAQRDTAASLRTRGLCWHPRPQPRCRTYLVTEVGYEHPVVSSRVGGFEPDPDFAGRFVLSIGAMVNRSPSTAWGGVVSGAAGDQSEEFSLRAEARYRRWVAPTRGVDIAAGLAHKPVQTPLREPIRANGLTAAIGVERWLARTEARVDALYGGGRLRSAVLVGVRATSYAAPVVAVILAAVGFAVAASSQDD